MEQKPDLSFQGDNLMEKANALLRQFYEPAIKKNKGKGRVTKAQQIAEEAVAYYQPKRVVKFFDVLVPEGYEIKKDIKHIYKGDPVTAIGTLMTAEFVSTIYHGHDETEVCRSRWMCHVDTYKPTGAESPGWTKAFYKVWPYLAPEKPISRPAIKLSLGGMSDKR